MTHIIDTHECSATPTDGRSLDPIELGVLEACEELIHRQKELVPVLALALHVPVENLLHAWKLGKFPQHGELPDTNWKYFFHGCECDLSNTSDDRFLRVDFGPHGRIDTFSSWGVWQFIRRSSAPWREFREIKNHILDGASTLDPAAGYYDRFCPIWDSLDKFGAFEVADRDLLELTERPALIWARTVCGTSVIWPILPNGRKLIVPSRIVARCRREASRFWSFSDPNAFAKGAFYEECRQ